MASSIDDFLQELDQLEKQKKDPPPAHALHVPLTLIEVGKSEVFEVTPHKVQPPENGLINVTTV